MQHLTSLLHGLLLQLEIGGQKSKEIEKRNNDQGDKEGVNELSYAAPWYVRLTQYFCLITMILSDRSGDLSPYFAAGVCWFVNIS
jgi:hypothetical protein